MTFSLSLGSKTTTCHLVVWEILWLLFMIFWLFFWVNRMMCCGLSLTSCWNCLSVGFLCRRILRGPFQLVSPGPAARCLRPQVLRSAVLPVLLQQEAVERWCLFTPEGNDTRNNNTQNCVQHLCVFLSGELDSWILQRNLKKREKTDSSCWRRKCGCSEVSASQVTLEHLKACLWNMLFCYRFPFETSKAASHQEKRTTEFSLAFMSCFSKQKKRCLVSCS